VVRFSESGPWAPPDDLDEPSLFGPEQLLDASRRQRGLTAAPVPAVCVLDPDGDLADYAAASCPTSKHDGWACYHTDLWTLCTAVGPVGVVGRAVGAPFAVLIAEQLAVSGADLVISLSSAGRVGRRAPGVGPGELLVIDRALRDEGTSSHYLPPARWSRLAPALADGLEHAFDGLGLQVPMGSSWTTDAPYRETSRRLAAAAAAGAVCVEMEAAALYAYAEARGRSVVCVAHLTNDPGPVPDTFDKGPDLGVDHAVAVITAIVTALRPEHRPASDIGPGTAHDDPPTLTAPKVHGRANLRQRPESGSSAPSEEGHGYGDLVQRGPGFGATRRAPDQPHPAARRILRPSDIRGTGLPE
jgi:uridine phosphorylase